MLATASDALALRPTHGVETSFSHSHCSSNGVGRKSRIKPSTDASNENHPSELSRTHLLLLKLQSLKLTLVSFSSSSRHGTFIKILGWSLMRQVQKLRPLSILKWVSSNFLENHSAVLKNGILSPLVSSMELITRDSTGLNRLCQLKNLPILRNLQVKYLSPFVNRRRLHYRITYIPLEAYSSWTQTTLVGTAPFFLEKLVKRTDGDVAQSVSRFLRCHPINEFEPSFESMGLKPSEYAPFLPRDIMLLSDGDLLLENYHVLCNCGIERTKLGKIYREAAEIFRQDRGVLMDKIRGYEKLGLRRDTMANFILRSLYILTGDVNLDLLRT